MRLIDLIRDKSGDRYFLMVHGDATFAMPYGNQMLDFLYRPDDDPESCTPKPRRMVEGALARAEQLRRHGGLDGFALCADYCLNTGPFLSPSQFGEFVTPYLAK